MSSIVATVSNIWTIDSLHKIELDFCGKSIFMICLELDNSIKVGTKVKLAISPSHIAIAKDFRGLISYSNIIDSTIVSINRGEILSSVELKFNDITIESIITTTASKEMDLKIGESIKAMLKATELSIIEVLND
ncbi:MAG: transporter [Epsilonproteobacteria bacterium]|nr:transporter [Campylobacterota bacterium]